MMHTWIFEVQENSFHMDQFTVLAHQWCDITGRLTAMNDTGFILPCLQIKWRDKKGGIDCIDVTRLLHKSSLGRRTVNYDETPSLPISCNVSVSQSKKSKRQYGKDVKNRRLLTNKIFVFSHIL
jgi:hypothetical protein